MGSRMVMYVFTLKFGKYLKVWNRCGMCSAPDWKVPTSFIYGVEDWMHYTGAIAARERMKVPCEILRVPQVCVILMFEARFRIFYL